MRMVFEKAVTTIIMATNTVEGGKKKCEQYWPDKVSFDPNDALAFGQMKVLLVKSDKYPGYIQNHLRLINGYSTRDVAHFWYTDWPDHGVPQDSHGQMTPRRLIEFLMTVREHRMKLDKEDSLLLVHCSAGHIYRAHRDCDRH